MIFSFWIAFIFFKLEPHKRVWKNKDSCHVIMPSEDTKMWEFSQYQKSDKAPFIIYPGLECIIEKIDGCNKNPQNSSKTKLSKHITSAFSMSTIPSFRSTENKHDLYWNKDCMKKILKRARNEDD